MRVSANNCEIFSLRIQILLSFLNIVFPLFVDVVAKDDENLEGSMEVISQSSPKAKRSKKVGDVEGTSATDDVSDSFWHKDFDFRRYVSFLKASFLHV